MFVHAVFNIIVMFEVRISSADQQARLQPDALQLLNHILDVLCSQGPYPRHHVCHNEGQAKDVVENALD